MLFQVYGENALFQWLGLILVFGCLILVNELTRRSKAGGIVFLFAIPASPSMWGPPPARNGPSITQPISI